LPFLVDVDSGPLRKNSKELRGVRILKDAIGYSIFALLAIPFVLWLALKAVATPSYATSSFIYILAIAYGLYSVVVGVTAKRRWRGSTFLLGAYIVAGASLIPLLILVSFFASGTEYTVFPAIHSDVTTFIGVLFLYYAALELVFVTVWCPFRKHTASPCANLRCEITKVCNRCSVAKSRPCEKCKLALVGVGCLVMFLVLFLFEASLIGRS